MAGLEHHAYTFDGNKLGVRTGAAVSGALSASWQAGTLDSLAHLTLENVNVSQWHTQARGFAIGADSVSVWLDDAPLPVLYDNASTNGLWQAEMSFTNGSHVVRATAYHPLSRWSTNATNVFIAVGLTNIASAYDAVGNVTNRTFSNGRVQVLFWDASGRLMQVSQRDAQTNGFDWTAVYDALGRRLQTVNTPVSNNVAQTSTTIDSWYDPQVEFLEIGVAVNGARTWKVNGPDLNGDYGASQGVGGLEATVRESDGYVTPVLNDSFGNVVATIYGGQVVWAYPKLVGYGPVAGYSTPVLSTTLALADATLWRTRRMDPTGFYWMGARYYDASSGRFLSPDPLGHDGSMDLYAFANGDPVNYFDPDGRLGKGWMEGWKENQSSPANSSWAYDLGSAIGNLQSGYYEGLFGGASITANTLTFGGSDYTGLTDSSQYQGGAYTGSRILSTIGRESALAAATFGTAQLARGGSQGALYTYQGLQTFNAGRFGYQIGTGIDQVSQGNNWGYLNIAGGALGFAGSTTFAAGNPGLNSLAGVGPSSGGFAQGAVNWWNLGSEGDAAFRNLSFADKVRSEVGMKALSDAQFGGVQGMSPVARGGQLMGDSASDAARAIFSINPRQVVNLLGTGPSPGARLVIPPAAFISSGGINVVNSVTMPLPGGPR